jgi:hypothetical protein
MLIKFMGAIMLNKISSFLVDAADIITGKKKKKWIQKIDLDENRFTTYCKKNGFDGPCQACADLASKSKDPSVRGMAAWYKNVVLKK